MNSGKAVLAIGCAAGLRAAGGSTTGGVLSHEFRQCFVGNGSDLRPC